MGVTVSNKTITLDGELPELIFKESASLYRSIKMNSGNIQLYDKYTNTLLRTLYPEYIVINHRHLPIKPTTGAAEAASDTWKEPIFAAPASSSYALIDVGVVPDYGTTFGQATNYFSLQAVNKGTDGTGTTAMSSAKAFSSAATVMDAVSFGGIVGGLSSGEVMAIEKSVTSSGMICQACMFYAVFAKLY